MLNKIFFITSLTIISVILTPGCMTRSQTDSPEPSSTVEPGVQPVTPSVAPALSASSVVASPNCGLRTPDISATRLLADINTLCSARFNGRVFASPGANDCADWLAERLDEIAVRRLPSAILKTPPVGPDDRPLQDVRVQEYGNHHGARGLNILGWIPSSDSVEAVRPYILIVAHYDSSGGSAITDSASGQTVYPGADDNASGVAVALELARSFSVRPHKTADIGFLFTDGEESGLLGSKVFTSTLSADRMPSLVVNLDMLGRSLIEPPLLPDGATPALACVASDSAWSDTQLIDCVRQVADKRNQPLIFWSSSLMNVWLGGQWVGYSHDGMPFESLGLRVLFFSDGAFNAVNSRNDTPDKINSRLIYSRAVFIETFVRSVRLK